VLPAFEAQIFQPYPNLHVDFRYIGSHPMDYHRMHMILPPDLSFTRRFTLHTHKINISGKGKRSP